ncbi:hypothetical protein HDV06_002717 [Boothiomyces sp. JEL0866]|nr:hypothetical protein HDV06_002717 [Boothiomyces sp. JEL0866]
MEIHQRSLARGWNRLVLTTIKKLIREGKLDCKGRNRFTLPGETSRQKGLSKPLLVTPISARVTNYGLITPTSITKSNLRSTTKRIVDQSTQTWAPYSPEVDAPDYEESVFDYSNSPSFNNEQLPSSPTPISFNEELFNDSIQPLLVRNPSNHFQAGFERVTNDPDLDNEKALLEAKILELEQKLQEKTAEVERQADSISRLHSSQSQLFLLVTQLKQRFKSEIDTVTWKMGEMNSLLYSKNCEIAHLNELIQSLNDQLAQLELSNQVSVTELAEMDEHHSVILEKKNQEIAELLEMQSNLQSRLQENRTTFGKIGGILKQSVLHE